MEIKINGVYKDLEDENIIEIMEVGLKDIWGEPEYRFRVLDDPTGLWEGVTEHIRNYLFIENNYTYIPAYNTPLYRVLNGSQCSLDSSFTATSSKTALESKNSSNEG